MNINNYIFLFSLIIYFLTQINKMSKIHFAFFIAYMLLCLHSCSNDLSIKNLDLSQIDELLEQKPDSSLSLLQLIHPKDSSSLSSSTLNEFHLLYIIAKDKCSENIKNDTIIFPITDYYKKGQDYFNITRSLFYSGRVLQENERYNEAMTKYIEAEEYSFKLQNKAKLKGLIQSAIGDLFLDELIIDKAILRYKRALDYFQKSGDFKNEIVIYNQIGLAYLITKPEVYKDSAICYFLQGINLADKLKNQESQMVHRHNLGLVYVELGKYQKAIQLLNEALKFAVMRNDSTQIYFNIARTYVENRNDSAIHYINKVYALVNNSTNYNLRVGLNSLKAKTLKEKGEYKAALDLYEDFVTYLEKEYIIHKDKNVFEVQRKYNYELMKNKHNEALIYRKNWIISLLIFSFVIISIGVILQIKSIKNRKALEDAKNKIAILDEMLENYNKRNNSLKSTLLEHFGILKKAALINNFLKKGERDNGQKILKKFNEIIYGQDELNWEVLYNTMNKLHDESLDLIYKTCTKLDEVEFKICCLIYAEFSNMEMSMLLGLSTSTIANRRSSIRRKLGIEEYGNINDFLNDLIKPQSHSI